jgi:hypothetical protein
LDPDEDRTYHDEGRYISHTFFEADEERTGETEPTSEYESDGCTLLYSGYTYDPDTGQLSVTVELAETGTCEEFDVTLAVYELPPGETGWNEERADQQVLIDADTRTLSPGGRVTLVVDVDGDGGSTTSLLGQPLGLSVGLGAVALGVTVVGRRRDH